MREPKQGLSLSDAVNGREIYFRYPFKSHTFASTRLEGVSEIRAPYINDFPKNLGKTTVQEYKELILFLSTYVAQIVLN